MTRTCTFYNRISPIIKIQARKRKTQNERKTYFSKSSIVFVHVISIQMISSIVNVQLHPYEHAPFSLYVIVKIENNSKYDDEDNKNLSLY